MITTKRYGEDIPTLEPGDTIICKGIKVTIKEIEFQDYWDGYGFIKEFTDTMEIIEAGNRKLMVER